MKLDLDHLVLLIVCALLALTMTGACVVYGSWTLVGLSAILFLFFYGEIMIEGNWLRQRLVEPQDEEDQQP